MQFRSGCSPPSCRKAPAELRRLHLLRTVTSVIPIVVASPGSKSTFNDCADASLWQTLQSVGAGATPESTLWQVKHTVWLLGVVLNVPFFSQKASPIVFGGFVTY